MEPDNRNQMRFPYPGNNVVLCQGMCGQMIYVNRAVEVVAAKLSTQLDSHEPHMLETFHQEHVSAASDATTPWRFRPRPESRRGETKHSRLRVRPATAGPCGCHPK